MGAMKTPGVYIVEKNAFPNSAVEVATAVPAFIGYTEFARDGNKSLLNKPWRITSMAEFRTYFGEAPSARFAFAESAENANLQFLGKDFLLKREDAYNLYYHIQFFYANGGGPCYIVSVDEGYKNELDKTKFTEGITTLLKEQEPTLLLVPECVYLSKAQDCYDVQTAMLRHCGMDMRNRIAIFDIYRGYADRRDNDPVNAFREAIGTEFLDFGAAYYPWQNTSIIPDSEISFDNVNETGIQVLKTIITEESVSKEGMQSYIDQLGGELTPLEKSVLHKVLMKQSSIYAELMKEMLLKLNLLPVSAAMAGIYTLTDNTREVWKAPANIGMNSVISPIVNISHQEQEDLNVPLNGKAVNAIRYFTGEGIKVWGARTLDGNSLDWRYINVRRTMIMLEESIRNASRAFVFEPNVANTWVSMKSMIGNFLNGIWKRGGLAGASPEEAFSVHVGLGETMTPEDILEGIMRITVLVAVSRPAEFIEITFQQQMQKS